MKTIGEILPLAAQFLEQKGNDRPKRDAEELLAAQLKCKRIDLFLLFDRPMEEKEIASFREMIRRRGSGEPLDYILGEKEFYGCQLDITPAVLIPRHETEILLEKICQRVPRAFSEPGQAWDLCTGSGCLGIAFKNRFPAWDVTLSDISDAALAVARKNAEKNGVGVAILKGDLFSPFIGKKTHVLMANPPYISDKEYAALDREVRDFEPQEALRGGQDGLTFYRRLSREAPSFLFSGGLLCLEIGAAQKEAVLQIFNTPDWQDLSVEQDWSSLDRFFFCRRT